MTNKHESLGKTKKQGLKLLQAGQLTEACERFLEVCRMRPQDAHAWSVLGAIYGQIGDAEKAAEAGQKSVALDANNADAQCNLGISLETLGRDDDALQCYRKALSLQPGHIEAGKNLAALLRAVGLPDEALVHLERALQKSPHHAGLHNDLANVLVKLERLDEAEKHYRLAMSYDTAFSQARINLAALQFQQGKREAAMADLETFIENTPDDAGAHHNLAEMLQRVGMNAAALQHYDEALRLSPEFVEAANHRGTVLQILGRPDEAEEAFNYALSIRPDYADAWLNLGTLHLEYGRIEAALAAFQDAIDRRENFAEAWNNKGNCLIQSGCYVQGIAAYERALALQEDYWEAASNRLMALHFDPELAPAELFAAHRLWGEQRMADCAQKNSTPVTVSQSPRQRLRIAYLSADFRTHSVGYFIEPILRAHNRQQFEVYCYADVNRPDAMTNRMAKLAASWTYTYGLDDDELSERIRNDNIDVLIDLAGHTEKNRLGVFARRVAPLQISYLGYPDTTGLTTMDVRLTDAVADPEGQDDGYSERLFRLSGGFLCYGPPADAPAVSACPGDHKGVITFASFNNLAKINDAVIAAWVQILQGVPDSRLLMKNRAFADAGVRQRYIDMFGRYGIAEQRLQLCGWTTDNHSHMSMYGDVDIALDSFPYNGTTTTCEALWMGVPVISLAGRHHVNRVGLSLLQRLGLAALCADDVASYIRLAIKLASNREKCTLLRESLRPLMQIRLCDALAFTQVLEQCYHSLSMETGYLLGEHLPEKALEAADEIL